MNKKRSVGNPNWVKGCAPTNPKGSPLLYKGCPSLNPSGGPKKKPLREALLKMLENNYNAQQKEPPKFSTATESSGFELVAVKLLEAAIVEGDIKAIRELWDRVEGKAVQPIAGDGENAPPVIEVKWQS